MTPLPRTDLPRPDLSRTHRRLALAGVAGVGGFVGAWAIRGATRSGYSPVDDAISRLAEIGAPGRHWMTAGFAAFGVGLPLYAQALRRALPGPAWMAATATGLATLGVGASPLGRADTAHYVFAGLGYVTLAATPLLAAREFRRAGASTRATASIACGVLSGASLFASTFDPGHGLTQRLGLTITDAWIIATALSMHRTGRLIESAVTPETPSG